ncbi:hypothetical protein OQH60_02595 [Campylobacter sp. MIT 21-1685]|uniref:hypothetical protein n=1 Tax=unclassified Campylobacter TaxID=2593542 RepID=UPI00224B0B7D|nr:MULTISPECIES: hypothetical protein [unclassified Campylobacter]MCX2682758.1 hypothetical protein [Campylobacter sp. MIT 21-1684]MCX2751096.1 hypothetical protein [Campylobacter sp. MIT 21-1682]MCX2807239.1 hypothetical protein [Campylobacter sp. MIT 21-1685]
MRMFLLLAGFFLFNACSLKQDQLIETDLQAQTLMFSQKYKISAKDLNAVVTLSYLNPVLEKQNSNDVLVLVLTPKSFMIQHLEVFINQRQAQIEGLKENNMLLQYLFKNKFSQYFKITSPTKQNETEIKAQICLNFLPCFELHFQKYPKSLYYRSVDVDTQYN